MRRCGCGWGCTPARRGRAGSDHIDHAPINRCARVKAAAHGGQVLVTQTTRDLAGGQLGGGFGFKRLGEFRLRDLAEPELIYQLTHADLPDDFPPLVTVAERAGNLPLQVSSFIGRASGAEADSGRAGPGAGGDADRPGRGGQDPAGAAGGRAGRAALRGWRVAVRAGPGPRPSRGGRRGRGGVLADRPGRAGHPRGGGGILARQTAAAGARQLRAPDGWGGGAGRGAGAVV